VDLFQPSGSAALPVGDNHVDVPGPSDEGLVPDLLRGRGRPVVEILMLVKKASNMRS
jgi:hypothetical protein